VKVKALNSAKPNTEVANAKAEKLFTAMKQGANRNGSKTNVQKKDVDKYLQQNMHMIIKLQAWFRGHTARRLIGLLRAKQLGSSKYFTQEEARETVSKRIYKQN
jgi:hypothetical protein